MKRDEQIRSEDRRAAQASLALDDATTRMRADMRDNIRTFAERIAAMGSAGMNPQRLVCSMLMITLCGCATDRPEELVHSLREEVIMVNKPGLIPVSLETTLFRPAGDARHPLVIINHGKSLGDLRFQPRARFLTVAREFVERGYAVALPMRQGFSKSTGYYLSAGCNVQSNGLEQAEDIRHVIGSLASRPDIDASRVVVIGVSHGGLTTLAMGALSMPNVVGLINFSGGLRMPDCPRWEGNLAAAVGEYATTTSVPSLWFYGENDSVFKPPVWQPMFDRYTAAGGKARLVNVGILEYDAHQLFVRGVGIWLPEVEKFFGELGLPFQPGERIALVSHESPVPPATNIARVDDVDAVPHLSNKGRDGYRRYLDKEQPRAFALAANGAWAWRSGVKGAMREALSACNQNSRGMPCALYSVDHTVVWQSD